VFTYLAILFAAAFLLLLIAYFTQQRANEELLQKNQETIEGLQNSMNPLQNLVTVNQALEEENAKLKDQVDQLQEQTTELDAARRSQNLELNRLLDETTAMQYFWQIDEAFAKGRTKLCRELIGQMEAVSPASGSGSLADYLSKENLTGNTRFSPYDRYQEIYEAVF